MSTVVVGTVAPYALRIVVTSADWDLNTVTGARFEVKRRRGVAVWSGVVVVEKTTTRVTLQRIFANGDLPSVERLSIVSILSTTSGELICKPTPLNVVGRH